MRRFRFPLARVHRWRAQQERAARRTLGGALAELGRIEQDLRRVGDGIAACRAEEGGAASALAAAVEQGLARARAHLEERRRAAAQVVELAQEAYLGCRRERRAVDRLLEVRREEWRREGLVAEQREIEEMTRWRVRVRREEVSSPC